MRLIIITILSLWSIDANANNYYVSNAGSDNANGASTGTSWQTIAKINSVSFNAGDSILFKKGDTWNEKIILSSSGTSGNVIYIGAYGSGSAPIISGLQRLTGFTRDGNIWTTTAINSSTRLNVVLINDTIRAKGRYPNYGYLTLSIIGSTASKITGSLTGFPDYTGAEIAVRSTPWVIDVVKIQSQIVDTFHLLSNLSYGIGAGGNGYFIQNHILTLDTLNEWSFDSTTKVFKVYALDTPNVFVSVIDTLLYMTKKSFITFDGISFIGANKISAIIDTSNNIIIKNCHVNNTGDMGIASKKSIYITLDNDTIQNSLNTAIAFIYRSYILSNTVDSSTIKNCYINNTAIFPGMGLNGDGKYLGIYINGVGNTMSYNTIKRTGYNPIQWYGKSTLIYRNIIDSFCFVKNDGGGIYTYQSWLFPTDHSAGTIIRSNFITNGGGAANQGTYVPDLSVGIYFDEKSNSILADSNTIINTRYAGFYCNNCHTNSVMDNTVIDSAGTGITLQNTDVTGMTIKRNIFYVKTPARMVFYKTGSPISGNFIDSNYYLRPVSPATIFQYVSSTYGLAEWTAAHGYDANSHTEPSGIDHTNNLTFTNTTMHDKVVYFSGSYYNVKGETFINKALLKPYTSLLLFKMTTQVYDRRFSSSRFSKIN